MIPVSIIMPSWNRAAQLEQGLESIFRQKYPSLEVVVVDDGSIDNTREVCEKFPVKYIYNPAVNEWKTPGRALNIGIRNASHDIVIVQNPEVVHLGDTTIQDLVYAVKGDDKLWIMANVERELMNGANVISCSEEFQRRCAYFLCCLWKKWLVEIRGVDEDYTIGGYEDDDLADRLIDYCGLKQVFTDKIKGLHLRHPDLAAKGFIEAGIMYQDKTMDMRNGKISHIRNLDREWGTLCAT